MTIAEQGIYVAIDVREDRYVLVRGDAHEMEVRSALHWSQRHAPQVWRPLAEERYSRHPAGADVALLWLPSYREPLAAAGWNDAAQQYQLGWNKEVMRTCPAPF